MPVPPEARQPQPRTLLEYLIRHGDYTWEEEARRFEQTARERGENASITARHLRRLAAGGRLHANPGTRRVLQALYGRPASELLAPLSAATAGTVAGSSPAFTKNSRTSRTGGNDVTEIEAGIKNLRLLDQQNGGDQLRYFARHLLADAERLMNGQLSSRLATGCRPSTAKRASWPAGWPTTPGTFTSPPTTTTTR